MKNSYLALLAALTLSAGSGCCLVDCFLGHQCGYGGGCDQCRQGGCSDCGPDGCAGGCCGDGCSCPPGGCGPGGCGPGGCANNQGRAGAEGYRADGYRADGYIDEAPPAGDVPVDSGMDDRLTQANYVEGGDGDGAYYGGEAGGGSESGYSDAGSGFVGYGYPGQPCQQCGAPCGPGHNCTLWPNHQDGRQAVAAQLGGPAGPPSAQITYPYYTTRGPRDFLMNNPPRIGP